MSLSAGSRLGPFEIVSAIGAGGMGEVYRARDTKLGRDVAIKVLPDVFAHDAERMARFGREAKLLAALDHPNIATIHGLEDTDNSRALVMQLAEGPTLADRVATGPIPIDDALWIGRQIADALEYAHEHGIIHRDLKPANVKVAADDTVKILDFGLAKALESGPSAADIANSPTLSQMATQAGVLLGTAAYMSPEQAKGKPVDRRADIWAFGCVLYEMLTGRKPFSGDTVTDMLAAIITKDPDWSLLPAAMPTRVRVLLQRCLQKDPKLRLRDIGDARISLDEVLSGAPDAPSVAAVQHTGKGWRLWLLSGVAGISILAAVVLAFLYFHQKRPVAQAMRFQIPLPEKFNQAGDIALSPDGRKLAFIGKGADGQSRLWVRSIDALNAQPLQGTEGAVGWPFWSPDSHFIVFSSNGELKKIDSSSGPPIALCDVPGVPGAFGGLWTRDGTIIFGSIAGLYQVSAMGGSASPLTTGAPAAGPSLLPDEHRFVYVTGGGPGSPGIYVGSANTKPQQQPSKKLLPDTSTAVYAPSSDPTVGYLLFVRGATAAGETGTLMAQRFDTRRLELTGEAVPIAEHVLDTGFSASATGALVYVTGASDVATAGSRGNIRGQLAWFDREGKVLKTVGDPGIYRTLALSPDGTRVALERADPQNPSTRNIWLYEFARDVMTRFTFDSSWDSYPLWSPDGSQIVFASNREVGGRFDLYEKPSNLTGEAKLLFKSADTNVPTSWSPDGHFLLYFNFASPSHVWLLPLSSGIADRKPVPMERSKFNQVVGRISPHGRWIAYASNESGRSEIYVRPFDASAATGGSKSNGTPASGKWMVSKGGGTVPLWRRDGKELFYLSPDGMAMAVDVNTTGVFQAGVPKLLFKVPTGVLFWDVSADGKRFLMVNPSAKGASAQKKFTVVLNWQAGLNK